MMPDTWWLAIANAQQLPPREIVQINIAPPRASKQEESKLVMTQIWPEVMGEEKDTVQQIDHQNLPIEGKYLLCYPLSNQPECTQKQ